MAATTAKDGPLPGDVDTFMREGPGKRFIEPRILFVLGRGPAHGYGIMNSMKEVPLPGPIPDSGAIYRKLREMEDSGLVTSRWQGSGPGPQRRVYRMTAKGRKRLSAWVEAIKMRIGVLQSFVDLYEKEIER